MESVLPPPVPFQLLRDPNSGQFLFFPTAATSIGMYIVIIFFIKRLQTITIDSNCVCVELKIENVLNSIRYNKFKLIYFFVDFIDDVTIALS